jgi:hypothetical protein
MKPGDHVELNSDLRWPGIVLAVFTNRSGEKRVVVEHTTNGVAGSLRIYDPDELTKREGYNDGTAERADDARRV